MASCHKRMRLLQLKQMLYLNKLGQYFYHASKNSNFDINSHFICDMAGVATGRLWRGPSTLVSLAQILTHKDQKFLHYTEQKNTAEPTILNL